ASASAGCGDRWTTAHVTRRPRPLTVIHSVAAPQRGQRATSGANSPSPVTHPRTASRRSAAASKKPALASSRFTGGPPRDSDARSSASIARMRAEDQGRVVLEDAAVAAHHHDVRAIDLAFTGLTPDLHDRLRQRRHPPHVERGELAAAGIARQRPGRAEPAVGDERTRFALGAEAVVLER